MNCRIYFRPDGQVAVINTNHLNRRPEEPDEVFLERTATKASLGTDFENAPFEDIDPADLPAKDINRVKWRKNQNGGVMIDLTIVTQAEKQAKLEEKIDVELGKPNPSAIEVLRLFQQIRKGEF